ncbi:hypothetical protein T440DRAFT_478421 [Plenodomus tracheiphilus IPT5]|uniref:Uncharacterized protein n=1 Tax=Plenodomus tracheiphilus IPT5 TaxID=1408161 RepID=A0A6A7B7U4_9PLEO|nr:hypothetical protein T440DRAFT_478421 [Plenodomus tracheiphilus IPT5]
MLAETCARPHARLPRSPAHPKIECASRPISRSSGPRGHRQAAGPRPSGVKLGGGVRMAEEQGGELVTTTLGAAAAQAHPYRLQQRAETSCLHDTRRRRCIAHDQKLVCAPPRAQGRSCLCPGALSVPTSKCLRPRRPRSAPIRLCWGVLADMQHKPRSIAVGARRATRTALPRTLGQGLI